jgi:DNA sulfur modification protein DndB
MKKGISPLALPSLRGTFGDWVYYSCTLPLAEVVQRVHFAEEIHKSRALSELIQRRLNGERAVKICDYLSTNEERFFNSLVLATYGGSPQWFDIGNLTSSQNAEVLNDAPEGLFDTLGILRLAGGEKIFALDGQHRLAGMRKALDKKPELGRELVPVLLVGHATNAAGSRRTRRLFTTLNKTAVAVKKMDIIALDEDDVMAITARRMVENDSRFKDPKVAVISSESMPVTNDTALLTIAALYDVLKQVIRLAAKAKNSRATDDDLRFNRPSDADLEDYHQSALRYFEALGATFKPVGEFLAAKESASVVRKYRTVAGGHLLFRTIGIDIFTQAAVSIAKRDGLSAAAAAPRIARLPTRLDRAPYRGVIWDPVRRAMKPANKALARRLIFHMLGLPLSARQRSTLLADYRAALGLERGDTSVKLPNRVA